MTNQSSPNFKDMANYLVQYTLKSIDGHDFIERAVVFPELNGNPKKRASEFYKQIIDSDGDVLGYYLYTANICEIIQSTDY